MRFRALPIEKELAQILTDRGDEAMAQQRAAYLESFVRHPGFQIIVVLLRDLEASALSALRERRGNAAEAAATIHSVDVIRRAIQESSPQAEIDWADEQIEEFLPPDIASFE